MTARHLLCTAISAVCLCLSALSEASAGKIQVQCTATNEKFIGFAGHREIAEADRDNLGDYFKQVCGDDLWRIDWTVFEVDRAPVPGTLGERSDQIGLMPMKALHKVVVPGHALETTAPNTSDAIIGARRYQADTNTSVFYYLQGSRPAAHDLHFDVAAGIAIPITIPVPNPPPNPLITDFGGYMLGLIVSHAEAPLWFGLIVDPEPDESIVLGGLAVGDPSGDDLTVAFSVYGMAKVDSAELTLAGSDKPIVLDPGGFKPLDDMVVYINPDVPLGGAGLDRLFDAGGSVLTVRAGNRTINALFQQVDEFDPASYPHAGDLKGDVNLASRIAWAALALSLLALTLTVLLRLRGGRAD